MVEKSVDTRDFTAQGDVTKSTLHSTISILHLRPAQSLRLQKDQDAPLLFHVFDLLSFEGQDLKERPLRDPLTILSRRFVESVVSLFGLSLFYG